MPAASADSVNVPSGEPSRRLLGSFWAKSGCAVTLPLEMNRSTKPSLLTSWNSGCQAVDGRTSPPVNGCAAFTPRSRSRVAIGRLGRPGGQRLEPVVALARQEHVGVAVPGHVMAGDAHPRDLDAYPAVGGR